MSTKNCYNFEDFRSLAKKKLPSPIFHYIDGGADDEVTLKRNTDSFNNCDLIPNVLTDVSNVDLSDSTQLGMSYNHISNASLGDKNPGANSYMFNFLQKF